MAWLSTPPTDWTIDKVDYSTAKILFALGGGSYVEKYITLTSTQKHKGGMTKAAADTLAASEKAANPADSVSVTRQNDAGAYRVDVHTVARGTWQTEE